MSTPQADYSAWQTVRSLSGATADATPTTGSAFVAIGISPTPRVEVRVRGGSLANSPTSVTLGVWRLSGGAVDKLGTITIASGDIATPVPQLFEVYDPSVYVTVDSFSGGASPTMTATIEARAVSGG